MSQAKISETTLADELIDIRREMRRAFSQGLWQELAELDKSCRSSIAKVVETRDEDLFSLLTDTLSFYRQLLEEFNAHKGEISAEVLLLRRAQSRNQVYRQMSVVR